MADSPRTRAALLALLADNITEDISPQDLRDMLVTLFGVWSAIYVNNGAVAQTGITTTPTKVTGFAADIAGQGGMTPDHTDDSVAVPLDGDCLVLAQISFSGTLNQAFEFHVAVNGTPTAFGTGRKIGTGGDAGSCSIVAPLEGLTAADKITLYVNTAPSGTSEITLVHAQLYVEMKS